MIKAFSILIIILFTLSIFSCKTSVIKEESIKDVEEIEVVTEESIEEEIKVEEEKSELEQKLIEIADLKLKNNIETIILDPYFRTDEKKLRYVNEVLELSEQGMMINYLFNNDYLNANYNPQERIRWIKAFDRLGFDEKVVDALLTKLSEAINPLDADEDGWSNLTEISGLDEKGNSLPFIDNDTGEKITYLDKDGLLKEDGSSNPLDPKDTPEHMAKFDMVLVNGALAPLDSPYSVDIMHKEIEKYYFHVKDNSHLDDLLVVSSKDFKFEIRKGCYINHAISFKELTNLITSSLIDQEENPSGADHIFFLFNVHGPGKDKKYAYFHYDIVSETEMKNMLNELSPNYDSECIFQFVACQSGNLSSLQNSRFTIMQTTDDGIIIGETPANHYTNILASEPFIDLGEAHNKTVDYGFANHFEIMGLQYIVKKLDNADIVYWDRKGIFEYQKDTNGNYIREETGPIIRIYEETKKPPQMPNFFMNDLFK